MLPEDKKIRVISISMGLDKFAKGYRQAVNAIEKAKEEGIFVITTSTDINYGFSLMGLGREGKSNPDDIESYGPGMFWKDGFYKGDAKLESDKVLLVYMKEFVFSILFTAVALLAGCTLFRRERHRYQQGDLEPKEAVTNISHDLRTPLTAISGYLDLLEREDKSENVQRYLSQIQNRTEVLKNLTEELFHYSVVASSQDLIIERIDVVRALEESLLSFYAVMQEKSIQPQIELPEETVWHDLDAGAVNRIFSNIISNVLKYSDGDFEVVMEENACITFANTARNLDGVSVGRLFDRFYTVEANRNSSGLGLSIAKKLTERMGGKISAQYQEEKLKIIVRL